MVPYTYKNFGKYNFNKFPHWKSIYCIFIILCIVLSNILLIRETFLKRHWWEQNLLLIIHTPNNRKKFPRLSCQTYSNSFACTACSQRTHPRIMCLWLWVFVLRHRVSQYNGHKSIPGSHPYTGWLCCSQVTTNHIKTSF